MEGEIKYEYARDDNKQLTSIKTGNRTVVVNESVKEDPLPRFHFCGNWRCRIYHPGQKPPQKKCYKCMQTGHLKFECKNDRVCRACLQPGHNEGDKECEHYKIHDAVCFKGDRDEFSNWYPCQFQWEGHAMHSSEQAYGYEMSKMNNRDDIKNDILRTKTGREAKDCMKKVYKGKAWEEKKEEIMRAILLAKVEQVKEVRDALLDTGDKVICEAVYGDDYWSCGMDKDAASKTDPTAWPGSNKLGELWMAIREEIKEEERRKKEEFKIVASQKDSSKRKHSREASQCTPTPTSKSRSNNTTPPKDKKAPPSRKK